jgi:DNA-binding protein Alba
MHVSDMENLKYGEVANLCHLTRKSLVMSKEQDVIFVGRKPPMTYVLAVITYFSGTDAKEVTLKARGQAINTAVDAAEITRNRFLKNLSVSKINIGTEEMPPREGETKSRNTSTIEITLTTNSSVGASKKKPATA